MTPRKELYIKVKEALATIPELELIAWNRNQFAGAFPDIWTAALISIQSIKYETMTEHNQEGNTSVDVILYCKDGWMDQHNGTADPEDGFMEIDLLDAIVDKLQFLKGEQFKPLQQTDDEAEQPTMQGIMSYRQSFGTTIYRKTVYPYTKKRVTITKL